MYKQYLREQGLLTATNNGYVNSVISLLNANVDVFNQQSVKEYLASKDETAMGLGRKRNIVHAYKQFHLMVYETKWNNAPKYKRVKKPQYLPKEENLLQIIAGVPNKYKPFSQMLYETGIRTVEAWNLKWSDIDFDRKMVSVTPAKNGNARDLPITDKLVHMLGLLPRDTEYLFRKGKLENFRYGFRRHRVKLAVELNEPELLKCSFKTFRTFYGTKCSYMFRDPFEVKYRMGHVQITTTELYIRREQAMSYEYTSHVTHTIEEAQQAIEDGFEYITDQDNVKIWRKPK